MGTSNFAEISMKGYLGADPKIESKQGEKEVFTWARLSIPMPRAFLKNKKEEEKTVWMNVAVFERTTLENIVPALRRGDLIMLKGYLEGRWYNGDKTFSIKVSNRDHYVFKILGETIRPKLDQPAKPQLVDAGVSGLPQEDSTTTTEDEHDDMPF